MDPPLILSFLVIFFISEEYIIAKYRPLCSWSEKVSCLVEIDLFFLQALE